MAIFNRKKANKAVLPEIEKYYDAEKRERAGLAWLLALTSIAVVALVLIGAFFGGRWVYRKATDNNKAPVITVIDNGADNVDHQDDSTLDTIDSDGEYVTPPTAQTTPNTPAPKLSNPQPGSTGSKELVNTGPAGTLAVFIVSVLGFTALHYIISASRRTN